MAIRINVTPANEVLRTLRQNLGADQVAKATARAMNHTISKSRTAGSRGIRKTYTMKAKVIRDKTAVHKARKNRLQAEIRADRRPLALMEFRARQTLKGVSAMVKRGKRKLVRSAFVQTMPGRSKPGVFARGGYKGRSFKFRRRRLKPTGPDLPIGQLRTVGIAQAWMAPEVEDIVTGQVGQDLPPRIEHEILRLVQRASR